jgi:excinuclease UvrABC ATPase subunit
MTLSTIDYELKTLYSVVIEAKDNGTTSLFSRCLVKVVINDLNDNVPSFQPDDFAINILVSESVIYVNTLLFETEESASTAYIDVTDVPTVIFSNMLIAKSSGWKLGTLSFRSHDIASELLNCFTFLSSLITM